MEVKLKPYQDKFFFSKKRFPALISGIGTGKTFMLLLKIWQFCEQYPNSLALIVRKEYTDLHDSTLKDFTRYFNVTVDSNKEYKFKNGSTIMFRHGGELSVLKNINLSIFGIEQAEEFDNEDQFTFLRDRLRRDNSPYRQGCLIANANGHNWMWRMWVNNPASEEYDLSTASTFENEDNLVSDFIADLRQMEIDAPSHYRQYVMNSFEEVGADDLLFDAMKVYKSPELSFTTEGTNKKILSVDVARFGDDKTVFTILKSVNINQWEQIFQESKQGWDLMQTCGRILDLKREFMPDEIVIDDTGVGGGVTDRLRELRNPVIAFIANAKSGNDKYYNQRDDNYFKLKEYFDKEYLKIINDNELIEQLLSIRFKYKSNGKKTIISKDEMRKEGIRSPDKADALMMAISVTDSIFKKKLYSITSLPRESESNFSLSGMLRQGN